jgi:competence protein ComEC
LIIFNFSKKSVHLQLILKPLTTLKLQFFSAPFVPICLAFCGGILLGFEFQLLSTLFVALLCSSIIVLISLFFLKVSSSKTFLLASFFIFFSLGAISVLEHLGKFNENTLESAYHDFDPLQVEIIEVGVSTSDWVKVVGKTSLIHRHHQKIEVNENIVFYLKNEGDMLLKGDVILLASKLNRIKNNGNPGEFDAENYWSKKGIFYTAFVGEEDYKLIEHQSSNWVIQSMENCRIYLSESLSENLKGKELAIAQALILGDKSLLDQEVKNSFTNTGAMHVLAVSGLHIGIIMQILMVVLGLSLIHI